MGNECANNICCVHCNLSYEAGDRECAIQQKEQVLCNVQQKQHVNRRRVMHIEYGNWEEIRQEITLINNCIMDEQHKRKLTPWTIEKAITQHLLDKPKSVRTSGKDSFIIDLQNEKQREQLKQLETINNIRVNLAVNNHVNTSKGLTYINDYNPSDFKAHQLLRGLNQTTSKFEQFH